MTAPVASKPGNPALQISMLIGAFALLLNIGFFFLSSVYFNSKRNSLIAVDVSDAHINNVRIQFIVFSGLVAAAMIGAVFAPKIIAHVLSGAAGLTALAGSYFGFSQGMPLALPVALAIIGLVFPLLIWRSLQRSRAAWSFQLALCYALALVLIFGAPKVRAQVGVGLWLTMILPGLLVVAGTALIWTRRDYRD
jgi:hypothetical protein